MKAFNLLFMNGPMRRNDIHNVIPAATNRRQINPRIIPAAVIDTLYMISNAFLYKGT